MVIACLLLACSPTPATTAPSIPATSSVSNPNVTAAPHPSLELSASQSRVPAGGCIQLQLSAEAVEARRAAVQWRESSGHWHSGVDVRLKANRGRSHLCVGWTGGPIFVRATAEGVAPSGALRVSVVAAPWMRALDRSIGNAALSASLVVNGVEVYGHLGDVPRRPASNEKLLLSMAALGSLGPSYRIPTQAEAEGVRGREIEGNLFLIGDGDPELGAADLRVLASRVRDAGITRIRGSVLGVTRTFSRDRNAPGWHPIALRYIGLPTALSFEHNVDANGFVFDPEQRAASALDADLRALGVRIGGRPGTVESRVGSPGTQPELKTVAVVRSSKLIDILRRQNAASDNLDAETLSKLLGEHEGARGSIASGATLIEHWVNRRGADATVLDASGLSYQDRISTYDLAALLDHVSHASWGTAFRDTLPAPGEGTLAGRLLGLPVRAKTGTLIRQVSALSGYVRLTDGTWASFSILSRLPKDQAVALEDEIVRAFARYRSTT